MSLHHYLYFSDTKVDMLLSQIDAGFARKHVTEVGADLKFVSVKRGVESATANRVTRLERVPRYLDGSGDVGIVDVPGPYVRGRLPMRWGPSATGQASLVYFGGSTERSLVGLGGASGTVPPDALASVHLVNRQPRGVEQEMEFLERCLSHGPSPYPELDAHEGMTVLLGSPLFVALSD